MSKNIINDLSEFELNKIGEFRSNLCKQIGCIVDSVDHEDYDGNKKVNYHLAKYINTLRDYSKHNTSKGMVSGLQRVSLMPNYVTPNPVKKNADMLKDTVSWYLGLARFNTKMISKKSCTVTAIYKINSVLKSELNQYMLKRIQKALLKREGSGLRFTTYSHCGKNDQKKALSNLCKSFPSDGQRNVESWRDTYRWTPKLSSDGFIKLLYSGENNSEDYICVKSSAPESNDEYHELCKRAESGNISLSRFLKSGYQKLAIQNALRNCNALAFEFAQLLGVEINYTKDTKYYTSSRYVESKPMVGIPMHYQVTNVFRKMPDVHPKSYSRYSKGMMCGKFEKWGNNFHDCDNEKPLSVYAYFSNCNINPGYSHRGISDLHGISDNVLHETEWDSKEDVKHLESIGCSSRKHPKVRRYHLCCNGKRMTMLKRCIPKKRCHKRRHCSRCRPGYVAVPEDLCNKSKKHKKKEDRKYSREDDNLMKKYKKPAVRNCYIVKRDSLGDWKKNKMDDTVAIPLTKDQVRKLMRTMNIDCKISELHPLIEVKN